LGRGPYLPGRHLFRASTARAFALSSRSGWPTGEITKRSRATFQCLGPRNTPCVPPRGKRSPACWPGEVIRPGGTPAHAEGDAGLALLEMIVGRRVSRSTDRLTWGFGKGPVRPRLLSYATAATESVQFDHPNVARWVASSFLWGGTIPSILSNGRTEPALPSLIGHRRRPSRIWCRRSAGPQKLIAPNLIWNR
jgi:hypothetical protein